MTRVLAVDPGDVRIGIAVSDPSRTLAKPLAVIKHVSRAIDAASIVDLANQNEVELIIIGQSYDEEGLPSPQGRKAGRLAEEIRGITTLPIVFWDESFTTQMARGTRIASGSNRKKRSGHLDDTAAALLLQSYLDAQDHFSERDL